MRWFVGMVLVVALAGCGGGTSKTEACDKLQAHRTAIQDQMAATDGNDAASIAAYNRLVVRSNRDLAAMKAKGCPPF